jgi:hypothetical protein
MGRPRGSRLRRTTAFASLQPLTASERQHITEMCHEPRESLHQPSPHTAGSFRSGQRGWVGGRERGVPVTSWHFVWWVDDSHSGRVARPLLVS